MQSVLLTGASGFIGCHLAKTLRDAGYAVSCLVRKTSKREALQDLGCQFLEGDILHPSTIDTAIASSRPDFVFHLAGITKAMQSRSLFEVNQIGTRNVLSASSRSPTPPAVVLVSSLAVAGPSRRAPKLETEKPSPVSNYGKSKLAAEQEAFAFCDRVPITIVRPPIVFGPHDRDTFEMFSTISTTGLHPVPSLRSMSVSWIHVDDVCRALLLAAEKGKRMSETTRDGIYFATSDEIVDYGELGRHIAHALGNRMFLAIPAPGPLVWGLAAINETFARFRGKQNILNFDKAREATAGSWTCSGSRLQQDTGFSCQVSLTETLVASAAWYREAGWL